MKTNYHNRLIKKVFTKIGDFCLIGSRRHLVLFVCVVAGGATLESCI